MIVFTKENIHVFFFTTQEMIANIVMCIFFEQYSPVKIRMKHLNHRIWEKEKREREKYPLYKMTEKTQEIA